MWKDKVTVITGGGHGIGAAVREAFFKRGDGIFIIDSRPNSNPNSSQNEFFVGDIGNKETLERFVEHIFKYTDHVDYIVNNAPPLMKGINECSWEDFNYAVTAH